MAEKQRIHTLAERLAEEYVTESGEAAPPDHIVEIVQAAAEPLADAPVQDFVPLLIENAARDRLHAERLHVEPTQEDSAPPRHDAGEESNRLVSGYGRPDLDDRR
jgi:hypothetical protein